MDEQNNIEAKIDEALKAAIAQSAGETPILPEEEEKFRRSYSWAAAIFGPVYFWAMGDWVFTVLSVLFALTLFPLLFILPFWARNRAWKSRTWADPVSFIRVQELWDKMALYFMILTVVIGIVLFKYVAIPFLQNLMSNFGSTNLNDTVKNYQELLQ